MFSEKRGISFKTVNRQWGQWGYIYSISVMKNASSYIDALFIQIVYSVIPPHADLSKGLEL